MNWNDAEFIFDLALHGTPATVDFGYGACKLEILKSSLVGPLVLYSCFKL